MSARTYQAEPGRRPGMIRRLFFTAEFALFADPYAIVALPLAVGLLVHLVGRWWTVVDASLLSGRDVAFFGACVLALSVFTLLVLAYAAIVVADGWRWSGRTEPRAQAE